MYAHSRKQEVVKESSNIIARTRTDRPQKSLKEREEKIKKKLLENQAKHQAKKTSRNSSAEKTSAESLKIKRASTGRSSLVKHDNKRFVALVHESNDVSEAESRQEDNTLKTYKRANTDP